VSDTTASEAEATAGPGGAAPAEAEPAGEGKAFEPLPVAGVFALFTATLVGGLALVGPYSATYPPAFGDPGAVTNVAFIVGEVLVATAVMLLAFRYGRGETLIRLFVVGSVAVVIQYPVALALPAGVSNPEWVGLGVGAVVAVVLWVYPEWYVIDAAAVVFGAGAIAVFGASLSPLPVLLLLVSMAVYDAYSVYVSEHMQSLGGGIVDLKLPMVFVVPVERGFSLLETDDLESLSSGAMLLGLGDAMFPGLLAASGAVFLDAPAVVAGLNAPALGAFLGGLVGMVALEAILFTFRRAHAGLPALNGGVIAGYLLGAVAAGVPLAQATGLTPYL
jgi:presenilin-like A22 family membrane protease